LAIVVVGSVLVVYQPARCVIPGGGPLCRCWILDRVHHKTISHDLSFTNGTGMARPHTATLSALSALNGGILQIAGDDLPLPPV
jgi:hypothetical protein